MKMWWSADLLIILLWCFSLPIASGVSDYKHFHWQKLFSSDKDLLFQSPRRNVCGHLLSPFDHVGRLRCDNTSSDKGKKHFRMEYRDEDLVQGGFGEVELHSDRFSIYNVLHEQAVEKKNKRAVVVQLMTACVSLWISCTPTIFYCLCMKLHCKFKQITIEVSVQSRRQIL